MADNPTPEDLMGQALILAFSRATTLLDPRVSSAAVGAQVREELRALGYDIVPLAGVPGAIARAEAI